MKITDKLTPETRKALNTIFNTALDVNTRPYDYAAAATYNKYVVNGKKKPENFGELLEARIMAVRAPHPMKVAFLATCWRNTVRWGWVFEMPTWEDMEAFMNSH